MTSPYDFTEVSKAILNEQVPDRLKLLEIAEKELKTNRFTRQLLAEMGVTAASNPSITPVELMEYCVRNGIMLGILLEREKNNRKMRSGIGGVMPS